MVIRYNEGSFDLFLLKKERKWKMYRNTYVKIDEEKLCGNVKEITSRYPEYKYYFGVVKGNAYGHGMYVVNSLIRGGVNYLAVATMEEAVKVREFNGEIPILCLEPISLSFLEDVIRCKITLTVDSLSYFNELNALSPKEKVKVHIKLDTGMNRLGIKEREEVEALFSAPRHENVEIEGIYTHLATSGTSDFFYEKQMRKFSELTENIDLNQIPIVHTGRSLTLVHQKKPSFVNGVRLGICLYGFSQSIPEPQGLRKLKRDLLIKLGKIPDAVLQNSLKLQTAFSLYSSVISVKKVKKGEFVGYGASFIARRDMNVATLAIGYYDGMRDSMKHVFLGGKKCPILGSLCMDMTHIEVPEGVCVGDLAEIFGENISLRHAAREAGVSAYKLLTGITSRVPRLYGEEEYYL